MTRTHLRVSPDQPVPRADEIALDWYPGDRRSTVQSKTKLLAGLAPTSCATDLLRVAVAAYCTDRISGRSSMADGWTRHLRTSVPVNDPAAWERASDTLAEALDFLSGDHWTLAFRDGAGLDPGRHPGRALEPADAVCLFSGGLDSLCGAIDLLEQGDRVVLVGHYEGGIAPGRQRQLFARLRAHYGDQQVDIRHLFLRPASPSTHQQRPLPSARENTMRARSILFISAGLAIASAIGPGVPLYIPENGYIGINVPLTGARPGSLSTRTTHPFFLDRLRSVFATIGLTNELRNPYRLKTKGETLAASLNPALLRELAPVSVSCSHPETARYDRRPQGNCGYCYPCLIRRASLHVIAADDDEYAYYIDREPELFLGTSAKGSSVRALIRSLVSDASPYEVLRTGPIPNGEADSFGAMYMRGRDELRRWLDAAGGPEIAARLQS